MKQELHQTGPLPYIYCVNKAGEIKRKTYGPGVGSRVLEVLPNGEPAITRLAERQGWITLSEAYAQDSRAVIRARGYQNFLDRDRAAERKLAKRRTVELANGKLRTTTEPIADKYLPEVVLRRRAGIDTISDTRFVDDLEVEDPKILDDADGETQAGLDFDEHGEIISA